MKYNMIKKFMTAAFAAAAILLASCGSTVSNSVIKAFTGAKTSDLSYAYVTTNGSRQTLSDYAPVSKDDKAVTETVSDLQDALGNAKLTETDKELSQSELIYVFRLSDKSILYLYNDGSIKTVDAGMNRTMYTGDNKLKKIGKDAADRLSKQQSEESDS